MPSPRIAILGGGPGGLLTAYFLQKRNTLPCEVVLFEASPRLGGKLVTRRFERIPVPYEAGAAELYDYSQLGPDPLRELIDELGLATFPMEGGPVVLQDTILRDLDDVRTYFGAKTVAALEAFNRKAKSLCSPAEYYESDWKADNNDPLSKQSFEDLLQTIPDPTARQYVRIASHSDLATETHQTSAMYGLQNYLMDDPRYMRLYGVHGGLECIAEELAKRLRCEVRLEQPVVGVAGIEGNRFLVRSRRRGEITREEFDYVAAALPNHWLPLIEWEGERLAEAIRQHHRHYDYPAHYLRVNLLFPTPFWREVVDGSYFMLDAFGGCCVYDESARIPGATCGVLGWLLGGEAALAMNNLADAELFTAMIDSLPSELRKRCPGFLEGRVHRWAGSVNGLPGGRPMREPDSRHQPDPVGHEDLFVVGDYLFDSTLNGVVDSADTVVEWIREALEESQPIPPTSQSAPQPASQASPGLAGDASASSPS